MTCDPSRTLQYSVYLVVRVLCKYPSVTQVPPSFDSFRWRAVQTPLLRYPGQSSLGRIVFRPSPPPPPEDDCVPATFPLGRTILPRPPLVGGEGVLPPHPRERLWLPLISIRAGHSVRGRRSAAGRPRARRRRLSWTVSLGGWISIRHCLLMCGGQPGRAGPRQGGDAGVCDLAPGWS